MGYVETLLFQYKACQYTAIAAITVWVYDYLLTIADELELLWSRNGILVKGLYLVGRYLPVVGTTIFAGSLLPTWQPPKSDTKCRTTFTILVICMTIQSTVSMTIFTLRLRVVFFMQPYIRRFLLSSLIVSLLCLFAYTGVALHFLVPSMVWSTLARACAIPNYHTWALGAIYITPIFMDSIIFFSTVYHAVWYRRGMAKLNNAPTKAVLETLYIDGGLYYGLLLGLRLGSVCGFYLAPMGLQVLFCYMEYLLTSTLTSRYFLSFRRKIMDTQASDQTDLTGQPMTGTGLPVASRGARRANDPRQMETGSRPWKSSSLLVPDYIYTRREIRTGVGYYAQSDSDVSASGMSGRRIHSYSLNPPREEKGQTRNSQFPTGESVVELEEFAPPIQMASVALPFDRENIRSAGR
ncbi:hypothetical protein FRC20_000981 [Serendipita sp. 405]|nr:hypothetical protein FRC20_000981 [Serendipita sp. 405]